MREKIARYVATWIKRCYSPDIPDDAPAEIFDKVPSYKRIAIAILSCDHALRSLGYSAPHSVYYDFYKRKELRGRCSQAAMRDRNVAMPQQLSLFNDINGVNNDTK